MDFFIIIFYFQELTIKRKDELLNGVRDGGGDGVAPLRICSCRTANVFGMDRRHTSVIILDNVARGARVMPLP